MDFHLSHGRLATVSPISSFSVAEDDSENKVLKLSEQPVLEGWINAGFFVLNRRIFKYLGEDDYVLEKELLEWLVRKGQLLAYKHTGHFFAMDTYRDHKFLNELSEKDEAPWKIWEL